MREHRRRVRSSSDATLVITTWRMPQGTIRSNGSRSVVTLSAKPCRVTHCFTWIPMLAILRPAVHTPVRPGFRSASMPSRPSAWIRTSSRLAEVPVEIRPMVPQIEDRIADQLAGAVEGDVAAALDLEDLDPAAARARSGAMGRLVARVPRPEGDDRRMLHQEQHVLGELALDPPAPELALVVRAPRRRAEGPGPRRGAVRSRCRHPAGAPAEEQRDRRGERRGDQQGGGAERGVEREGRSAWRAPSRRRSPAPARRGGRWSRAAPAATR